MKLSVLCSSSIHPVNDYLLAWMERHKKDHEIDLIRNVNELSGGDILFLVSCADMITVQDRTRYGVTLVLHASDLPLGRGWSPHIWEISAGAAYITLTLLEAEDKVDSGKIWKKLHINVPSTAMWDEINHLLFSAEVQLMDFALASYGLIQPQNQSSDLMPSFYRLRTPEDSRIDPNKSLIEQFNLIRVCDPNRFPAFFEYQGKRFVLKLEKIDDE